MNKINPGFLMPSSCFTVPIKMIKNYKWLNKKPKAGDLVYGKIKYMSEHSTIENKQGRIHQINDGSYGIFVFGNRYAPDAYEGTVPERMSKEADLLSRSGVIGQMKVKNDITKDPTRVDICGFIVDEKAQVINTTDYSVIHPRANHTRGKKGAKLILHIGTSMNSGKSTSAIACCWALSAMGYKVRASKVTGTASLKDILYMQDAGAEKISDFSYFGHPSTYRLEESELLNIFTKLDYKFANNPEKYWVVEFADGILQRETGMLLRSEIVKKRISKLILSASDAFSAIGGLHILKDKYGLLPDAISGRCTSSPLGIRELKEVTEIPVYNNISRNLNEISKIII